VSLPSAARKAVNAGVDAEDKRLRAPTQGKGRPQKQGRIKGPLGQIAAP